MEIIAMVLGVSQGCWEHGHHYPAKQINIWAACLLESPKMVLGVSISNFLVKKEKRERGERVARKLPTNTPNTIEQCRDLPNYMIYMKKNSMVSGTTTPSQHPLNNLHTPI